MMGQTVFSHDPHRNQPIRLAGEPLERARAAMLLVHGRGASADDILTIAAEVAQPGFAYFAPEAANHVWYPNSFLAPLASNEPWLSSALSFIGRTLTQIVKGGVPVEKIILLGFSQGACLVLEYAARNAMRYGGLVGLSGGLIGPAETPRDFSVSLAGTPAFLGCSDVDPYIPKERVSATTEVLNRLGARVTERFYPGMAHTVNDDEISFISGMMRALTSPLSR